jgi:hypothetical protein
MLSVEYRSLYVGIADTIPNLGDGREYIVPVI